MVQNVGCLKENTYLCNRKSEMNALLAQLVEQLTLNQWVQGSNPCGCTKEKQFVICTLSSAGRAIDS